MRAGSLVPGCQLPVDGRFEFFNAAENSPPDLLAGEFGKPAFRLMEPRTARKAELEIKLLSLLGVQPALNRRAQHTIWTAMLKS